MNRELKQSSSVVVLFGPFVSSTDGDTINSGLTITQAETLLSKNGGALTQKDNASSSVYDSLGYYRTTVSVVDTGTLGHVKLVAHRTATLSVEANFSIVDKNYWSSKYSSDIFDVNTTRIGGTVQTGSDVGADTTAIRIDTSSTLPGRIDTLSSSISSIPTTTPDAAGVVPGRIDTLSSTLTVILGDTAELQTDNIPGRLDTLSASISAIPTTTPDEAGIVPGRIDTLSGSITVITTAINEIQGTGFASSTSSLAAIRTRGDLAWTTGGGEAAPTVTQIREEMDSNSVRLAAIQTDTSATLPGRINTLSGSITIINTAVEAIQVDSSSTIPALINGLNNISTAQVNAEVDTALSDYNGPTNTEMEAAFTQIKGATFASATDSLEAIRNRGDEAWLTGAGGSAPTVQQIREEIDANSERLAAIQIDTSATLPGRLNTLSSSISLIPVITPDAAGVVPGRLDTMSASISAIPIVTPDAAGVVPGRIDTLSSSITVINTAVEAIQIDSSSTIPALIEAVPTASENATGVWTYER